MFDLFKRKINYARISITDLCNLRCRYCMPECGVSKHDHAENLSIEQYLTLVSTLQELGVEKIRITGGEPFLRKGVGFLFEELGKMNFPYLTVTTNGTYLKDFIPTLEKANVTSVNMSLDTLDPKKFKELTMCDSINSSLDGLNALIKSQIRHKKLNVVLIKGFNDDEIENFAELTMKHQLDLRFIELMPIGSCADWTHDKYLSSDEVLNRLDLKEEADENGGVARYYRLSGAKGRIGLISPLSHMFCDSCNRIRFTADGKTKNCLHSNDEFDIKPFINDKEILKKAIYEFVMQKPEKHGLNEGKIITRNMGTIGG